MTTAEQNAIAATASAAARKAAGLGERPSMAQLYDALAAVPDPEIPVVSVVELGIVRDLGWDGDALRVRVTPTYSGCPATDLIAANVRDAIRALGVDEVRVETALSPPWTTDWIAPEAKERLRAYGIAPPGPAGVQRVDVSGLATSRRGGAPVACPRCGATTTT